jgi:hypothetical protein
MTILKDKISVFQDGARHCLDKDGYVCPMFAYADGADIKIATAHLRGSEDKDRFADFMVSVIREHGVKEYLTVTEAWILAADAKTADEQYQKYGSLKDVPGREEAIVIAYFTPTTAVTSVAKIDRSSGKPVLCDWQSSERKVAALDIAESGCRFMGLFAKAARDN